jgi:hypothetical protein
MTLLELAIVMLVGLLMIISTLPSFIATKQRDIANLIYSHLVTLDKALWNIDFILYTNDSNLHIPRPSSCSVNRPCNLVCGAKPYLWKNLSDYSGVRDQLYDNFLDPRGKYKGVFTKYRAYLVYQNLGGGRYKYTEICLNVGREIGRRIRALDGGSRVTLSGDTICYQLNQGAGYEFVTKNYNCQY